MVGWFGFGYGLLMFDVVKIGCWIMVFVGLFYSGVRLV